MFFGVRSRCTTSVAGRVHVLERERDVEQHPEPDRIGHPRGRARVDELPERGAAHELLRDEGLAPDLARVHQRRHVRMRQTPEDARLVAEHRLELLVVGLVGMEPLDDDEALDAAGHPSAREP
jgi:hypothetical protein